MTAFTVFDAHTHIAPEEVPEWSRAIREDGLAVAVSCSEPAPHIERLRRTAPEGHVFLTCGVHPWQAAKIPIETLLPAIKTSDAVGEIGLDNVWCEVPMDVQQGVFLRQLELAAELRLPVVLHTKGCEAEIADTIKSFPGPFLVHWYSADTIYPTYLEKDCYFSIGPDIEVNPAVQQVARTVRPDRLLAETDGTEAVGWALGRNITPAESSKILQNTINIAAKIRGVPTGQLRHRTVQNALAFYTRKSS